MTTPTLNRPREARESSPESRAVVTDSTALMGASDADYQRDSSWYDEVARHLDAQGFCLCSHCLGRYCFGTRASADYLVSAVARRMGLHPLKIAHRGA